ncbi:MAG: SH3 domain protein [Woeseiaceae bacterium]|jgi:SH3 domain protein
MRYAFLIVIMLPVLAVAETAYVTDNLRLGLHEAADTSDRAFRTLESGQEVEIISRDQFYAAVRLPDGTAGNVKVGYLVFDKPAKLIVAETQAEVDSLSAELTSLKAAFAAPAETISSLESQLAQSNASAEENTAMVGELTEEVSDLRSRQDQYKFSLPITWVGGAMFVCLLAGFLGGLWWLDQRSRKRHGGIRIY